MLDFFNVFSWYLKKRLPSNVLDYFEDYLQQIIPSNKNIRAQSLEESMVNLHQIQKEMVLRNLTPIPEQAKIIQDLMQQLNNPDPIVICGAPYTGKTEIIKIACELSLNLASDKSDSSRSDVSVERTEVELPRILPIRPIAFTNEDWYGVGTQRNFLGTMIENLSSSKRWFIVIEGPSLSVFFEQFQSFPKCVSMENGDIIRVGKNITFILVVEKLEMIPDSIRSRSSLIRVKENTLNTLMESDLAEVDTNYAMSENESIKRIIEEESHNSMILYLTKPFLEELRQPKMENSQLFYHPIDLINQVKLLRQGLEEQRSSKSKYFNTAISIITTCMSIFNKSTLLEELTRRLQFIISTISNDREEQKQEEDLYRLDQFCMQDSSKTFATFRTETEKNIVSVMKPILKSVGLTIIVETHGTGNTSKVIAALELIDEWEKRYMIMTPETKLADVQQTVVQLLRRVSLNRLEPIRPLIFVMRNFQFALMNEALWNFISFVVKHKTLYLSQNGYKALNIRNLYFVGMMSSSSTVKLESFTEKKRRFSLYVLPETDGDLDEQFCRACHETLRLEDHEKKDVITCTSMIYEMMMELLDKRSWPLKTLHKNQIYMRLIEIIRHGQESMSEPSKSTTLNLWLFAVQRIFMLSVIGEKSQNDVCGAIEEILQNFECLRYLKLNLLTPTYSSCDHNQSSFYQLISDKFSENVPSSVFTKLPSSSVQVLQFFSKKNLVTESVKNERISLIFHVVLSAIKLSSALERPALILVVDLPNDDIGITSRLLSAATDSTYQASTSMGTTIEMLQDLLQLRDSQDTFMTQFCLTHLLDQATRKNLYELLSKGDSEISKRSPIILTATDEEVLEFGSFLNFIWEYTTIIRVPYSQEHDYQTYANHILEETFSWMSSAKREAGSKFIANLHHQMLARANYQLEKQRLSHPLRIPSIYSIVQAIELAEFYYQGKEKKLKEMKSVYECIIAKSRSLQEYAKNLKDKHKKILEDNERSLEIVQNSNERIEEEKQKHSSIQSKLIVAKEKLTKAVESHDKLHSEFTEYDEDLRSPLREAAQNLSEVDMDRVKKLVSRAPVAAVQLVFEGAVILMGHTDVSWKIVRQATNNPQFCSNLASKNVEDFDKDQIYSVLDNIKQIKITDDHMARMSDIGSVLLKYLKAATFFWRRFKEDLSPRFEKLQESLNWVDQLKADIASLQNSLDSCLAIIQETTQSLHQEQKTTKAITSSIKNVESDLKTNETLMTSLEPHIIRWQHQQEMQKQQLSEAFGESLLEAAASVYLAHIPGSDRKSNYKELREKLKQLSLLVNIPEEIDDARLQLDIFSNERILEEIVTCYKSLPYATIFVFDPQDMESLFFGDCTPLTIGQTGWEDDLIDILNSSSPGSVIGTHEEIELALKIYKECKISPDKIRFRFIITDCCKTTRCETCSNFPLLSLELTDITIQQILCCRFSSAWPVRNELMSVKMDQLTNSYDKQLDETEITKKALTDVLMKADDTSSPMFIADIREKMAALEEDMTLESEKLLEKMEVLDIINEEFGEAAKDAQRIWKSVTLMSLFFPEVQIPFHVFLGELTKNHKRLTKDFSKKDLKNNIRHALFDLISPRVGNTSKFIIAVSVYFSQLPENVVQEDTILSFLEPLTPMESLLEVFHKASSFDPEEYSPSKLEALGVYAEKVRKNSFRKLLEKTPSLFGISSNEVTEYFIEEKFKFIDAWKSGCIEKWEFEHNENEVIKLAQMVVLSRHFNTDILLDVTSEYLKLSDFQFLLDKKNFPVTSCIEHRETYRRPNLQKGSSGLVEIHYRSRTPPYQLLEESRQMLGKYNKIIYSSQSSLSKKDLKTLLMKVYHQNGWLCFLDCEILNDLGQIIHGLRSMTPALMPFVFCFYYASDHLFGEIVGVHENDSNLSNILQENFRKLFQNSTHYVVSSIHAMYLLVSSVFQARKMVTSRDEYFGTGSDMSQVSRVISYYVGSSCNAFEIPWDTITSILSQILFLDESLSPMDDSYFLSLMESTLDATAFMGNDVAVFTGNSSVQADITRAFEELEDLECNEERENIVQVLTSSLISKCTEITELESSFGQEILTEEIIKLLNTRTQFPSARLDSKIVLEVINIMQKSCGATILEKLEELERQKDAEFTAWQLEATEWEQFTRHLEEFLGFLKQETMKIGSNQTIVYLLEYLNRNPYCQINVMSLSEDLHQLSWEFLATGIKSLLDVAKRTCMQRKQLLQWATHEFPPHKINLGLLKSPVRWLNQFKRSICSRAHWNLKGAVVYGTIPEVVGQERPFQGVYIDGCVLQGGRFANGKLVVDSTSVNQRVTLSALVNHCYPVPKHNQKWIRVVSRSNVSECIMQVLVRVEQWISSVHLIYIHTDSL